MGDRYVQRTPAQWVDLLETFARQHARLPRSSADERSLYAWIRDVQRGRRVMPAELRKRFEAVMAATPAAPRTGTGTGRAASSLAALRTANTTRSERAAAAIMAAARRVLASDAPIPQQQRDALIARVAYPDATYDQIAVMLGVSKATATGRIRRAVGLNR